MISADPWPLTLATYNIHAVIGSDRRFSPERIAEVLQEIRADIIALQEVPLGGLRVPDVLAYLQKATGFAAALGPPIDLPQGQYGNAVLTRFRSRQFVALIFRSVGESHAVRLTPI